MGSGNIFNSYKKLLRDDLNSTQEKEINKLTEHASSIGAKLKFNLNMDFLDSLNFTFPNVDLGILNPLKDKIGGHLNGMLGRVRGSLSESLNELLYVGKDFLSNIIEVGLDLFTSRIYILDEMHLITLKSLKAINANPKYQYSSVRNVFIKADMVKCLEFMDTECGISYSYESGKRNITKTLSIATKKSCIKVTKYVLGKLASDMKLYRERIASTEYFLENYDIDDIKSILEGYEKQISEETNSSVIAQLVKESQVYLEKLKFAEKRYAEEPKLETHYKKNKSDLLAMESIAASNIKNLITYSYANISPEDVHEVFTIVGLTPSILGDDDEKFNGRYSISSSNVDIIAPFFKAYDEFDNTNLSRQDIQNRYSTRDIESGKIDTSSNSAGFMENTKDQYISENKFFDPNMFPTYIDPRNVRIKEIYVILASDSLWGTTGRMNNEALYTRLLYPIKNVFLAALDDAAKNLATTGLGSLIADATNAITTSIYDVTMEYKSSFYDPSKVAYAYFGNNSTYLPPPAYGEDNVDEFMNKFSDDNSAGYEDRKTYLGVLQYFLEHIPMERHSTILKLILHDAVSLYNTLVYSKVNIEDAMDEYFSIDITDNSLDVDAYVLGSRLDIQHIRMAYFLTEVSFIRLDLIDKIHDGSDLTEEQEKFNESIISDINKIDSYSYTQYVLLLHEFINAISTNMYNDSQIYQLLIHIYNAIILITISTDEDHRNVLLELLSNAFDISDISDFDITSYVDSKTSDERLTIFRDVLSSIYLLRDKLLSGSYDGFSKNESEKVIEKLNDILIDILPVYDVVIESTPELDHDIRDEDFIKGIIEEITKQPPSLVYIRDWSVDVVTEDTIKPGLDLSQPYDNTITISSRMNNTKYIS